MSRIFPTKNISMQAHMKKMLSNELQRLKQTITKKSMMKAFAQQAPFDPITMKKKFQTLEERKRLSKKEHDLFGKSETEESLEEIKRAEDSANRFSQKNPELAKTTLMILREKLSIGDNKDDILKKVLDIYADYTIADEALDFLKETTTSDLLKQVSKAKTDLNESYKREIKAGKNITEQARQFSKEGLGSPTALRDLYRDITGNRRTPFILFEELSSSFTYFKMKTVIDFILHSLGADLKSKGPSISRGELQRLTEDTRTLQAILWVYRFFKSRMNLIKSQFKQNNLDLPSRINFESLAKQFMKTVNERYLSSSKILKLSILLGISEDILAQIIIFTQMRDALRQTAPKLYKSTKERQNILNAFLETLEELEDNLDEDEEEEEKR